MFAMIGTLFLWVFWPSFNSGNLVVGTDSQEILRMRVIINTVFSLTGSCLTAISLSKFMRGKFEIEDVLNATLAGGVVIGSVCSIVESPVIALVIGCLIGAYSSIGFSRVTPCLN
jgi:ammonium transporter Rh